MSIDWQGFFYVKVHDLNFIRIPLPRAELAGTSEGFVVAGVVSAAGGCSLPRGCGRPDSRGRDTVRCSGVVDDPRSGCC